MNGILLQGVEIRCHINIRGKISHHRKIRIRLAHDHDNGRLFSRIRRHIRICRGSVFLSLLLPAAIPAGILLFQRFHRLTGIPVGRSDKTVSYTQHKIQNISVAVASFLLPGLCHYVLRLMTDIHAAQHGKRDTDDRHRHSLFKGNVKLANQRHIERGNQNHIARPVIHHELIIARHRKSGLDGFQVAENEFVPAEQIYKIVDSRQ